MSRLPSGDSLISQASEDLLMMTMKVCMVSSREWHLFPWDVGDIFSIFFSVLKSFELD